MLLSNSTGTSSPPFLISVRACYEDKLEATGKISSSRNKNLIVQAILKNEKQLCAGKRDP